MRTAAMQFPTLHLPPMRAGLVSLLPMWLAPNLITLVASACIAIAYAVNALYLPDFTGGALGSGARPSKAAQLGGWAAGAKPPAVHSSIAGGGRLLGRNPVMHSSVAVACAQVFYNYLLS